MLPRTRTVEAVEVVGGVGLVSTRRPSLSAEATPDRPVAALMSVASWAAVRLPEVRATETNVSAMVTPMPRVPPAGMV